MKKTDLIECVALGADITWEKAQLVINSLLSNVTESISNGETIQIAGLGKFSTNHRRERAGRNPQTGDKVNIPATISIKFAASKRFKRTLLDSISS